MRCQVRQEPSITGRRQVLVDLDIVVQIVDDDIQIVISIEIANSQITSLALILHEWATNSTKYGALSVPDGKLSVEWERKGETKPL